MAHFLGVDIGGTSTRLILMDDQQVFQGYQKVATRSWADLPDPIGGLERLLAAYLQGVSVPVSGVMLGLPGILSHDRRTVLSLPFIPALDGQPVAQLLTARLGLPVGMDKDVNHLMWWDLTRLDELPEVAVGVYLGTGFGNSLWLNGDFYHGAHGGAGEIGHIPLKDNLLPCPCGKTGCVETLTSGSWLSGWARRHAPETAMSELFVKHGDRADLQAFVERLACTIASEMNILDPQYLVLGGGVLAMAGFPQERLQRLIRSHLRSPYPANGLTITLSGASDETGCRGACLAAQRRFKPQQLSQRHFPLRREA